MSNWPYHFSVCISPLYPSHIKNSVQNKHCLLELYHAHSSVLCLWLSSTWCPPVLSALLLMLSASRFLLPDIHLVPVLFPSPTPLARHTLLVPTTYTVGSYAFSVRPHRPDLHCWFLRFFRLRPHRPDYTVGSYAFSVSGPFCQTCSVGSYAFSVSGPFCQRRHAC